MSRRGSPPRRECPKPRSHRQATFEYGREPSASRTARRGLFRSRLARSGAGHHDGAPQRNVVCEDCGAMGSGTRGPWPHEQRQLGARGKPFCAPPVSVLCSPVQRACGGRRADRSLRRVLCGKGQSNRPSTDARRGRAPRLLRSAYAPGVCEDVLVDRLIVELWVRHPAPRVRPDRMRDAVRGDGDSAVVAVEAGLLAVRRREPR